MLYWQNISTSVESKTRAEIDRFPPQRTLPAELYSVRIGQAEIVHCTRIILLATLLIMTGSVLHVICNIICIELYIC